MKIVHSFWSKPAFHAEQAYSNARKWGGWLSVKHALLSSCFSCLRAQRHHSRIELHTDDAGFDLLINKLQLPYDTVVLSLNVLESANHRLWVLGKFIAYKNQYGPFVHIDNDVYLWKTLILKDAAKPLLTQSRYRINESFRNSLSEVFEHFSYIPECVRIQGVPDEIIVGNAGIIGGSDVDFFQEYCCLTADFINRNALGLTKVNLGHFNTILDEYLFACFAKEKNREISYLINAPIDDPFKAVLQLHLVPFIDKYVHLVGFAKQNKYACEQLELRLAYEFSGYYKKAVAVIEEMFPEPEAPIIDPRRKKQLFSVFSIVYNESLQQLLQRKIRLSGDVLFEEVINRQNVESEWIMHLNGSQDAVDALKLEGQNELLTCFESPASINELLAVLKEEAGASDVLFEEQKQRLIDFVLEKIVVEGTLEFV